MAIILVILHLNILLLGSGINRKSSLKLTLVASAKEGQNINNSNNPVQPSVQCRKDHAGGLSRTRNNSRNLRRKAECPNINISGRHSGSSNITTSRSSNTAADDSIIISGSLSGRRS